MAVTGKQHYTEQYCESIVSKIKSIAELPVECKAYANVVAAVQKKEKAGAFAGLSPGEAAAAARARQTGRLNQAQLQRRMTTRRSWKPKS
mmetsp:Transcript_34793/g.71067  ORF Transcript_34793/g.71067 Transcript_34793/m.71067 type:complete len:90 (-) Transcript_34793:275-544(-)